MATMATKPATPATPAQQIHHEAIVIDATCPILRRREYLDAYIEGGLTAVAPTVDAAGDSKVALKLVASWLTTVKNDPRLLLVKTADDILTAKETGRLGIILHFQGTSPLDNDLDLVHVFKELGVGIIQLAYNTKNRVGDGCEERTDCGLSRFGVKLIKELNEARVIVDCSHTGHRTSMEAVELSEYPVVCSHSNPAGVTQSSRNISDELITAVAGTGGLVGINGFPAFVSSSPEPTLDEFIAHIDYVHNLVGPDHIGLGIDYFTGQAGVASLEVATVMYDSFIKQGIWQPEDYPAPPFNYPKGIEIPQNLPNLTVALVARGYHEEDIKKILGGNWVRVYRSVWDA